MFNGTVFWMEAEIQSVQINKQGEMEFRFEPVDGESVTQSLLLTVANTGMNATTRYGYCIVGRTYDKFDRTHHVSTTTNLSNLIGYRITNLTSYDGEPSLPDETMYRWISDPVVDGPYPRQRLLYEKALVGDEWVSRHDYLVTLIRHGSVDLTIYIQTNTKSQSLFEYGRLDHRVDNIQPINQIVTDEFVE